MKHILLPVPPRWEYYARACLAAASLGLPDLAAALPADPLADPFETIRGYPRVQYDALRRSQRGLDEN